MQERRGGKAELIADVGDCRIEEGDSRRVSMGGDEGVKARLNSLEPRMAADAFRHIGEGALRLLHGEQPELEEAVARDGRHEVRVAATGVEHQALGVAGRQARQLILDLERAQLRQFGVIDCAHDSLLNVGEDHSLIPLFAHAVRDRSQRRRAAACDAARRGECVAERVRPLSGKELWPELTARHDDCFSIPISSGRPVNTTVPPTTSQT